MLRAIHAFMPLKKSPAVFERCSFCKAFAYFVHLHCDTLIGICEGGLSNWAAFREGEEIDPPVFQLCHIQLVWRRRINQRMYCTYVTYMIRIFIYYMRDVLLGDEFVHLACEKKNRNRRPLKLFRLRKYNISLIAVEAHINPSAATANGAGSLNYFSRPEAFVTEKSFGFILIIWTIWTLIGFLFWRFMQLWKWLICITPRAPWSSSALRSMFPFSRRSCVSCVSCGFLTWTDALKQFLAFLDWTHLAGLLAAAALQLVT